MVLSLTCVGLRGAQRLQYAQEHNLHKLCGQKPRVISDADRKLAERRNDRYERMLAKELAGVDWS